MTLPIGASAAATLRACPEMLPVERCPLCGGAGRVLVHTLTDPTETIPGEFALRRCAGCGATYVDPRPPDELLVDLYDRQFYFSTGWSYGWLAARVIDLIQWSRRRRVERRLRPGRLLDVGCGDGAFAHAMARRGWDATGIDFSPAALEFARRGRSPARFRLATLDDAAFADGAFDAITMWQVLEHIGEPRRQLLRCRALLRPGGLLVVAVPNVDGLSARLTGARWWGLDVPRHLVHWTPATLRRALAEAGFRVVRVRHRSLQYDPYALMHSTLDWVFTRRHFLSDFAKRHAFEGMGRREFAYNLAALVLLAPVLAPASLVVTSLAALARRGGFIEVHALRD